MFSLTILVNESDSMQTELYTISKLFTERVFRIPDYQRGYAWTKKQLRDYWTDFEQLEEDKSHYLGVLTLEDVPADIINDWKEDHWIISAKSYAPFYVVDGQQRLTTTIILLQAIIEYVPSGDSLNYTSIESIKQKFIWDSKDDGISRSYIFGYEKDNPSYEFLKTEIFQEESTSSATPQQTIYTQNLLSAKLFFKEKLNGMSMNDVAILYRKVTQQALFNIYAISREVDVFIAFETMNNRGKPLSHLELLKNRLIYLSTQFNVPDYEKTQLRSDINESWKSVYHHLGRNKEKPLDDDNFLRVHFILYFGTTILDSMEEPMRIRGNIYGHWSYRHFEYKDYLLEEYFTKKAIGASKNGHHLTINKIHEYSKNLKASVELWYKIQNPKDSGFAASVKAQLERIQRLGMDSVAPLIMAFFNKERKSEYRIQFLEAIENILFFERLSRYHMYVSEGIKHLEYAMEISSGKTTPEKLINDLRQLFDSLKNDKNFLNDIESNFRKSGFYDWVGLKYFLYEYDASLREKSKTSREKLHWDSFVENDHDHKTIEHIYPQRPRKACWTSIFDKYDPKERNRLRHSLGNLVPLSRPKNSSFSNKCFADKKGTEDNKVGFRYGSYAENEIAMYDEWTPEMILKRGLKLLDFLEERWNLQLGDRSRKVRLLGLEFLLPKRKTAK